MVSVRSVSYALSIIFILNNCVSPIFARRVQRKGGCFSKDHTGSPRNVQLARSTKAPVPRSNPTVVHNDVDGDFAGIDFSRLGSHSPETSQEAHSVNEPLTRGPSSTDLIEVTSADRIVAAAAPQAAPQGDDSSEDVPPEDNGVKARDISVSPAQVDKLTPQDEMHGNALAAATLPAEDLGSCQICFRDFVTGEGDERETTKKARVDLWTHAGTPVGWDSTELKKRPEERKPRIEHKIDNVWQITMKCDCKKSDCNNKICEDCLVDSLLPREHHLKEHDDTVQFASFESKCPICQVGVTKENKTVEHLGHEVLSVEDQNRTTEEQQIQQAMQESMRETEQVDDELQMALRLSVAEMAAGQAE